jgi:hypothetical protein
MCAQAGVRLAIVMKEDVFHVSVMMNSADVLSQFVSSFCVPLMMCSEVRQGTLQY